MTVVNNKILNLLEFGIVQFRAQILSQKWFTHPWAHFKVGSKRLKLGLCHLMSTENMFRDKTFQVTLPGYSYRMFIEGLKSPVTKAAYSYALQKYMVHLNITNPDDLLVHQENPKIIQDQIIDNVIQLKNPPHSLRCATRSQYLAAIMTFYDLNDVALFQSHMFCKIFKLL